MTAYRDVAVDIRVVDKASPEIRALAERARRLGLTVTSSRSPEEKTVPRANPYDRRTQRHRETMWTDGRLSVDAMADVRPPLALAIDDLNAIAYNAVARGRQEEADRLRDQHAEELLAAQRAAWAEGHEQGEEDARRELLQRIDQQHGADVRAMLDQLGEALEQDRLTKGDLREHIAGVRGVLLRLVEAHHNGFVSATADLPF